VFATIDNAPEVRVRVPPTVTLPHNETALLIVRLFNVTPGKLAAPAPPIIILEVGPPIRVPQKTIIPLSVKVFAPIDKPAPAGVNVPLIVSVLCKVTIFVFHIERPNKEVTLVGIKTPGVVPPNTRLDTAVVIKFEGVPAMVGPFNVSVFIPTLKVPAVRVRVPFTDKFAPKAIFLLVLKLFNPLVIKFNVRSAPVPIVRLEVIPPVNEPPA
jgi:hypothetical protein